MLCDSAPDADTWLVFCFLKLLDLLFNNARRASAIPSVAGPCVHDSGIFFCEMHGINRKIEWTQITAMPANQSSPWYVIRFSGDDNASTMAARIRRLPYSKALLAAPQPHGWGGTSESRARRPTGFPGRASAPWVRGKVHTGVTRGSIQFIAPFREPEKNPVVDLALSRANTADSLCARRFPSDCASMTRRFIILRAVPQSSLRHTCHLHHRDGDRYSAGPPDRAISYGRTSEPAS